MEMLLEEHLDLGLVDVAHGGRGDGDFVPVFVGAGGGEGLEGGEVAGGDVRGVDAEGGEGAGLDGLVGVVGEALVALEGGWGLAGRGEWRVGHGVEGRGGYFEVVVVVGAHCVDVVLVTG